MAVIGSDPFDGDDTSLNLSNWTELVPTRHYEIVGGAARPSLYSNDTVAAWTVDTWPDDQYVEVILNGLSGGTGTSGIGLALRATSSTAYYRVIVNTLGSDNVNVQRFNPGSTLLGSRTQAFSDGDVLRAEIEGSTIRVYHNGTQMGADIEDGSPIASGDAGIAYSSTLTAGEILAFEGGDVEVAPPPDAGPRLIVTQANRQVW